MNRFIIVFYGLLAASCWLACVLIMIFRPWLATTNERALIGFTIMGALLTCIWLFIIKPSKPLSYGRPI